MESVPYLRPIGLTCGILSTLQALIWCVSTTVANLIYNCVIEIDLSENFIDPHNITNPYVYFMYERFLKNDACFVENVSKHDIPTAGALIQPQIINIWLWFYFGTSLVWLVLSIFLIKICAKKETHFLNTIGFIWFLITLEISGMDCALAILFGIEISNLLDNYKGPYQFEMIVGSVTLMCVAIRGIVLWLLNILLAIIFMFNILKVPKDANNPILDVLNEDDHTSFSSKFAKSSFRRHPVQWQPPIDAFNYSSNNIRPSDILNSRVPKRDTNLAHLGWTLRRSNSKQKANSISNSSLSKSERNQIPTPDYSPKLLPRNKNTLENFVYGI